MRKQAQLSHCSDGVDDLSLVVDPDDVDGLHFEGFPVAGMLGMNPPSSVPRYVALIATLSPAATMSWISAVMSGDPAKKMQYESIAPFLSGVVPGNT